MYGHVNVKNIKKNAVYFIESSHLMLCIRSIQNTGSHAVNSKTEFLLLHRAFWNIKLVIHQQMHYLLHLERFNFTQEIT
jgi:hypothetical protein